MSCSQDIHRTDRQRFLAVQFDTGPKIQSSLALNLSISFGHVFWTVACSKTITSSSCVYTAGNLQQKGVMAKRKKWFNG